MKSLYIVISIVLVGVFSCTKQQGPIEPVIEIASVSYTDDIQPIFDTFCISCHNATSEESFGELNLASDQSYDELVNTVAVYDTSVKRVLPNNHIKSLLWQKINDSGMYGDNMPWYAENLSQHNQDLIKTWINEGALNN